MARPATARKQAARRPPTPRPGARPARPGSRKRPGTTIGSTVALTVIGLLVVAVLPLCLVLVVGMGPTIGAAIFDRQPQRHLLRSVAMLNVAGMVQPVATLLHLGLSVYGAAMVLFDPYQWLWMYGSSAMGWLCFLGMPPVMHYVIAGRAARAARELQARAESLVAEWGEEVDPRKGEAG